MHSPKNCLPGSGWEPIKQDTVEVPLPGDKVRVTRYVVQRNADRNIVLYWYQTPVRVAATEFAAKFWLIWDSTRRAPTSSSIVRVVIGDRPGAMAKGLAFTTELIPRVQACFRSPLMAPIAARSL